MNCVLQSYRSLLYTIWGLAKSFEDVPDGFHPGIFLHKPFEKIRSISCSCMVEFFNTCNSRSDF